MLGFAASLAVLTCLLFGLAPAIRATRMDPGAVMKTGGRGMTASRERFSLRRALTVTQVALSLVLVAGALLFSRSLGKLLTADTGFRQEGILIADVGFRRLSLPLDRYPAIQDELLARIRVTSLLFGISPTDTTIFIGAATLVTLVSLLAIYVPARNAMSVDPLATLRHE